ncbi:hypothetical protein [Nonomuraea sp. NPDC049480]|uniref:hypothetical protein n=1 Tax=Nonomuraea sp. NPDC049480 TaxID=3364353 RepID=UPI00378DE0B1
MALHSDRQLGESLEQAQILGSGIGGSSALLAIEGVPVFAKRIPLTDLERRAGDVMSTANLFGLPPFCQYGFTALAGPGFGAWRELAAGVMTTNWVLAGRSAAFPLLYHWRVLPGAPPPIDEHADVEAVVQYWDGSPAVRDRLHALARASAGIVLFQEFIPYNLDNWLVTHVCGVAVPQNGIPAQRNEYIRACANGADPAGAPPAVAPPIRTALPALPAAPHEVSPATRSQPRTTHGC